MSRKRAKWDIGPVHPHGPAGSHASRKKAKAEVKLSRWFFEATRNPVFVWQSVLATTEYGLAFEQWQLRYLQAAAARSDLMTVNMTSAIKSGALVDDGVINAAVAIVFGFETQRKKGQNPFDRTWFRDLEVAIQVAGSRKRLFPDWQAGERVKEMSLFHDVAAATFDGSSMSVSSVRRAWKRFGGAVVQMPAGGSDEFTIDMKKLALALGGSDSPGQSETGIH